MADWKEIVKLPPEEKKKIKYNDPRLDKFAAEVEARYGLPSGLIEAVKNAGERSNTTQQSQKGAKGVMQFIDRTRKQYKHDYNDPLASIDAAGQYFKDLLEMTGGNVKAALAQYNGGTKARKAAQAGGEIPFKETQDYISRIMEYGKNVVAKRKIEKIDPPMRDYSDEELLNMSHTEIYALRDKARSQEEQNRLGKFEHRVHAREEVYKDLSNIPGMLVATAGYTPAKLLGFMKGRSEASWEEMEAGFQGIADGISKRMQEGRKAHEEQKRKEKEGAKEGAVQEGS